MLYIAFPPPPQPSPGFPPQNFSYPPPPKQPTPANPPPGEAHAAAYATNPYGQGSVSPPPQPLSHQPTPSQSSNMAVQAQPTSVGPAQFGQFVNSTTQDDVGTFNGGSYRISHRDSNSLLTLQLAVGCPIEAKPGKCYFFRT
jgi:hypothetical protein